MAGYIGSKSSVTLVDGITKNGGTLEGDLSFGDNDKAIFGAGSDLQIYHDGGNSYIKENGSGALALQTNGTAIVLEQTGGENMILANINADVKLYYNGSEKLATTSTGVDVTGTVTADGLTVTQTGSTTATIGATGTSGDNDGTLIINNGGSGDGMLRFDYETNTDRARIGVSASSQNLQFYTAGNNERMRIDSSGKVGIGTSSPTSKFEVFNSGNSQMRLSTSASGALKVEQNTNGAFIGTTSTDASAGILRLGTGDAERMRIDTNGHFYLGKTSTSSAVAGIFMQSNGGIDATRSGSRILTLNRLSSDGSIIEFQKDNTNAGYIGTLSGSLYIGTTYSSQSALRFSTNTIHPCTNTGSPRDNAIDLGYSGGRFDDIYATNGTIQTSDFNEKQDIASLTATEMLVGARISALFKTFRWKDSVAEKGDNARTHTGVIAQDVQAAFTAEGLDAGDYALFISSTWWETQTEVPAVEAVEAVDEVTDEDGNVTTEAVEAVEAVDAYTRTDTYDTEAEAPEGATSKTRMGIRYPELLSFVAAYNEQRFASIEARLTALEA